MTIRDSDELLATIGEPLATPGLRDEFLNAFEHEWCEANPYSLDHATRLTLSWRRFAHLVRTRHRYFFLSQLSADDDELVAPARMLEIVAQAIHVANSRMVGRIPAGYRLTRARAHRPDESPTSARELGSPPSVRATANRMSPAGISMFYATDDPELAWREARRSIGQTRITRADWTTLRDVWCLDLMMAEPIPSLFDMTGRFMRPWLRFLKEFADDLSRSPDGGQAEIDYIPTQVVTEFVRDIVRTPSNEAIMGIRYASAIDTKSNCLVVFAEPHECTDAPTADALLLLDSTSLETRRWSEA